MSHPFRFGVQAAARRDATAWAEYARRVEGLGYSTLFMPDHYVGTDFAPMVGLSFAAAATTTLRLGPLVLGNDYKHPATVAKEAASLDVLSGGRLEFGIGAGWQRSDYTALGLPYDPPGVRIERLAEALEIVRRAWGDGAFDFEGEHYTITDYDGAPKPLQQPRPPIVMGGGGPKMLRLAGQMADIVGINPILRAGEVGTDAALDTLHDANVRKVGYVREGAGERFDEIELQVRYFFAAVTDDPLEFAGRLAPVFGIGADEGLESGVVLAGTVDEICDTLVARRETTGVSYLVFGDEQLDAFAPVVARLAGT
jgi:probable F420-dependent oxidoreductase